MGTNSHFPNHQPSSEDKNCDIKTLTGENDLFKEKAIVKVKMEPVDYLILYSVL